MRTIATSILFLFPVAWLFPRRVIADVGKTTVRRIDRDQSDRKLQQTAQEDLSVIINTVVESKDGKELEPACIPLPEDYEEFQEWYDYNIAFGFFPGSPMGPSKAAFDFQFMNIDPYYDYWFHSTNYRNRALKRGGKVGKNKNAKKSFNKGIKKNKGNKKGAKKDAKKKGVKSYNVKGATDEYRYGLGAETQIVPHDYDHQHYPNENTFPNLISSHQQYSNGDMSPNPASFNENTRFGGNVGQENFVPYAYNGIYNPNLYGPNSYAINGLLDMELEWCDDNSTETEAPETEAPATEASETVAPGAEEPGAEELEVEEIEAETLGTESTEMEPTETEAPDEDGTRFIVVESTFAVDFFESFIPESITQDDVDAFLVQMDLYYREILSTEYPELSDLDIEIVDWSFDLAATSIPLSIDFDSTIFFPADSTSPTAEDVNVLYYDSDYAFFITEYAWMTEPVPSQFIDAEIVYYMARE